MEEKRYDMLSGNDREEEIRIKKIKQGLIPDTEGEAYQKEKAEREAAPVSLEDKWKNFWYHNKVTVFIVSFVVLAVGFLTYQGLAKEQYDTTILYCSYAYYDDTAMQKLSENIEKVMTDIDGNDEVNVGVFQATYTAPGQTPDQLDIEQALQSRVMAEIMVGENCIFIVQKEYMDFLADKDVFCDLREVAGIESDEPVYSISLADSSLLKDAAFDKERDNFYIALRVYKEGTDKKSYEAQANAVKAIVQNKAK